MKQFIVVSACLLFGTVINADDNPAPRMLPLLNPPAALECGLGSDNNGIHIIPGYPSGIPGYPGTGGGSGILYPGIRGIPGYPGTGGGNGILYPEIGGGPGGSVGAQYQFHNPDKTIIEFLVHQQKLQQYPWAPQYKPSVPQWPQVQPQYPSTSIIRDIIEKMYTPKGENNANNMASTLYSKQSGEMQAVADVPPAFNDASSVDLKEYSETPVQQHSEGTYFTGNFAPQIDPGMQQMANFAPPNFAQTNMPNLK